MRSFRLFFAALAIAAALPALAEATTNIHAKEHKFGLGFGGSSIANGVSGKLFLDESFSLQATAGYWWPYGLALGVDALFEGPQFWSNQQLGLNWFAGAGAGAVIGTYYVDSSFFPSISAVGGVSLQLAPIPLEITAEIRPVISIAGGTHFDFGGGGAIRYYF